MDRPTAEALHAELGFLLGLAAESSVQRFSGKAQLIDGKATVSDANITEDAVISLTKLGTDFSPVNVQNQQAGSFEIRSADNADTSEVGYVVEPGA